MFGIGPTELLVVFLFIIVFFGAKRLPELARSLGRSIKEFKNATQGLREDLDFTKLDEPPEAPPHKPVETKTSGKSEKNEAAQ